MSSIKPSSNLIMSFLKWVFTWLLALLPILFIFFKQLILEGNHSLIEVLSTGELFLVSIVMIAEPFISLITNGIRGPITLCLTMFIILALCFFSYFFCIVEMNEKRIEECKSEIIVQNNSNITTNTISRFPALINRSSNQVVELKDVFLNRIEAVSLTCFIWAFCLGIISVWYTHIIKTSISKN